MTASFSAGKTTFFGIIFSIATLIMANPSLLGELSGETQAWVKTVAGIVVAISGGLGFAAAQNNPTPAEQEVKELKKESEREGLKQEIKEEVKVIAAEKAAELIQSKMPAAVVAPVVIPEITADVLTVSTIHTDSVKNSSETDTQI